MQRIAICTCLAVLVLAGCQRPTTRVALGPMPGPILSTRTSAVAEFTGPDCGKTAHYMLRWLSTRGEAGPWSETAGARIGA